MHRVLLIVFCLLVHASIYASSTIAFKQSYDEILEINFGLKAANAEIYARKGDEQQAGAIPNPTFAATLNTFGYCDPEEDNEVFLGITQLIELGGKRSARLNVADAIQTAAEWDYEIRKKELFANVLHAFIDMATAQEKLDLAHRQQKIAEEMLHGISEKSNSGKISCIEGKKAEVTFQIAKIAVAKQLAQVLKIKKELMAFWNGHPPIFDRVSFPLHTIAPPPPLEALINALQANPELAKAQAEAAKACRIVSLERAQSIPNIAVQVGMTTEQFVKHPSLTVGFEIPIPLFDRNQGNIHRASFEHVSALYNEMDILADLTSKLSAIYEEWIGAYNQAIALKESVLPVAEESFQLAQESYRVGKFDYLHLLDARSTLINVKEQYIEALQDYHHKRTEALRLTGF